jgi:hypothetical protein
LVLIGGNVTRLPPVQAARGAFASTCARLRACHCACELPETRIGGEPMLPPVIFSLSIKIVKFILFNQISQFIISNQISLLNILQFLLINTKILII